MTTPDLRALAAVLGGGPDDTLRLRKGTVVRVEPTLGGDGPNRQQTVAVTLGGATTQFRARTLAPVPLVAGDAVWVAQQGPLLLVLGTAESRPNTTRFVATLNALLPAGFYEVLGDTAAPDTGWWHVVQTRHTNDSSWGWQVAYEMQGPRVFTRRSVNGGDPALAATWSPWSQQGGDTGWQAGTYQNGWATYGANWHAAAYRRHNGVVHLRGLVAPTVAASLGAVVFTLPVGFRPASGGAVQDVTANLHLRGIGCSAGETGVLQRGNGDISHWNVGNPPAVGAAGTAGWIDLSCVRPFLAEQ